MNQFDPSTALIKRLRESIDRAGAYAEVDADIHYMVPLLKEAVDALIVANQLKQRLETEILELRRVISYVIR